MASNVHAQSFESYIEQADSLFYQDYLKADSLYKLAEQIVLENKDERQNGIILIRKARVHINNTEYDKSLTLLQEALKTFTRLKDTMLMADTEQDMGLVYRYTKDYKLAAKQNKKALDLWKTQKDSTQIGIGHRDLGVIYRKLGELDKAREQYDIALTFFDPIIDRDQLVTLNGNIATLKSSEGNFARAIEINKSDLPYIKSKSEWRSLSTRYNNIAYAYIKMKDLEKAMIYSDSAIGAAHKANVLESKIRALRTRNKVLNRKKDYKSAYENYKLYKKLSDSARTLEKVKEVTRIITVNQYEKQRAIDSLQFISEKKILNDTITKQTTLNRLYLIIGILALSALSFLWFGFKQRKKRLEHQLKTSERESTRLIEEARLRTTYKQAMLKEINDIIDVESKGYKKKLLHLRYTLNEDIRHESESLFSYKEGNPMYSKLDQKLLSQYPALTKRERQMCSYLIAGLSTKEIAELKNTTQTAVRTMRSRIRKKMNLEKKVELRSFLETI